jgi:prolyl oligopeptidase
MNLLALALVSVLAGQTAQAPQPARNPRRPVVDTHHGVEVVDPYRWLEDSQSPEVKAWSEAQAAAARAYLDGLPNAKEIREQVKAITVARSPTWFDMVERRGARGGCGAWAVWPATTEKRATASRFTVLPF